MNFKTSTIAVAILGLASAVGSVHAQSFSQGFNDAGIPAGWTATNVSTNNATGNPWTTATTAATGAILPFEGTAFAVTNFTAVGSGTGTINNWLYTPLISGIKNGDSVSFYTTTVPASAYPDRLELRLSGATGVTVGTTATGVGTFTTLLTSVNPGLAAGGYPESWTQVTYTFANLAAPLNGYIGLRYFVTSGGPTGANSNIIGVDNFVFTASVVPEPATWAMSLMGVAGLLAARRLRDRKAA